MEGGTDHDLRILDLPTEEEEEREKLASVSRGTEAPKREDPKTLSTDSKPIEKDRNEKVCVLCLTGGRRFMALLMTVNCATGGQ